MEVTSGASWSTTTGLRQWSIALNENDGRQLHPKWDEISWPEQRKFLQQRADLLVLKYMYENGAMAQDQFQDRVAQIGRS